ncbi:MAG TPA: dihydrofolate reductase family protein [Anaerolineae bacterium]
MRKVIFRMMMSLDGYMSSPTGDLEWVKIDEELHRYINEEEDARVDTHLYGRRMYELMAEFWPTADEDPAQPDFIADYARIWKRMRKIVFSRTVDRAEGAERVVKDDIAGEVRRLKEEPGKDMTVGGRELAAIFMREDLIDEYEIYVNPLILGEGIPLFSPLEAGIPLELLEARRFGSGVVLLRYGRGAAGPPIAQEQETND